MENSEYNQRKLLISSKVETLLGSHDCVIIPGFGGFVGSYAPAKVHPVTYEFVPPSKHILFNAQLKTDDGILVHEVMADRGIEFSEARTWIAQFSELMIDRIMAGERTELPCVGTFTIDPERNLQFRQAEHVNFLAEAYGLYPIQASPIIKTAEYSARVISMPKVEPAAKPRPFRHLRKIARVAAAACLIGIGMFYLPSLQPQNFASFSIFSTDSSDNLALNARRNAELGAVRRSSIPQEETAAFSAESAHIFIVAGCYATPENAEGVISYLNEKGFNAFVLDQTPGGLQRVVYGSYPSISEASAELASIRKGFNEEAWMLVR